MIIYPVLAAQYESLKDPLIILITVPLSICGALLPLALGYATMNIYTRVGLVTLIGLISKHGILMVEFANELQMHQGLTRRAAILQAAQIRLRPVLMTTGAMVFGLIPLLFASGAAASRFGLGLRSCPACWWARCSPCLCCRRCIRCWRAITRWRRPGNVSWPPRKRR